MKKIRRIHMWIGIIATVFLLIESTTGIIMYFQGDRSGSVQRAVRANGWTPPSMSSSQQNGQAPSGGGGQVDGSGHRNFGNGHFGSGGMNQFGGPGNFSNRNGGSSFLMNVRSLHQGVIGLISGIGMLIMTATGIVMSFIIWGANRKKKNRDKNEPGQITVIQPPNPS